MLKFITKKIFSALISILILFTLGFVLFRLLPGDPISLVLRDPRLTPEQIESFKKRFGLDKPLWMQYLIYLANAFRAVSVFIIICNTYFH